MSASDALVVLPPDAPEPAQPPAPPPVPAWKLVSTLGVAGGMAGLMLVFVFQATQPRILAHKAKVLDEAVQEVLGDPERYDTLYVLDGALTATEPTGPDAKDVQRVYLGYDASDAPVGYAIPAAQPGFQDVVKLIFGYDAAGRRVIGMKVLESKETPGLGDKIEKDSAFTGQFVGRTAPLLGVKSGASTGESDIDMITGATISSRAVIRIINDAVEELQPALDSYSPEAPR